MDAGPNADDVSESAGRASSLAWFRAAKFGLFVHFGPYAVLGRGEQVMVRDLMSLAEYEKLAHQFRPASGWADRLCATAVGAGAKYIVMTTRHHDGYCLFETATHYFHAGATGPGRDLVREFVEAARRAGLRVGLYYSVQSWRWPGFWDHAAYPDDLPKMVDEVHAQVEELMTGYGPIDVLWYDAPQVPGSSVPGDFACEGDKLDAKPAEFWRSAELNAMVRRHQPGILINDRSGLPEDFGTPEQVVRPAEQGRLWETCMTLNPAPGWGFLHGPLVVKSPAEVLWHLLDAVRRGGNFLFNVGPDATGALAPRDIATLAELGRWLEHHGEAVYDTHPGDIYRTGVPQGTAFHYGMFTQRRNVAYLTFFYPPPDGTLVLTRLTGGLRSATLLDDGAACEIVPLDNDRHRISGLPTEPSAMPRVVKLTFNQPPKLVGTRDASWLFGTHRQE